MLAAAFALRLGKFGATWPAVGLLSAPTVVVVVVGEVHLHRHIVCFVLEGLLVSLAVGPDAADVSAERVVVVSLVATVTHVHVARSSLLLHVSLVIAILMTVVPLLGCQLLVMLTTVEAWRLEVDPRFRLQDSLLLGLADLKAQLRV